MKNTHFLQAEDTCAGIVYLQSIIIVKVSESLASWKGAWPHTSIYKITPKDQTSKRNIIIWLDKL